MIDDTDLTLNGLLTTFLSLKKNRLAVKVISLIQKHKFNDINRALFKELIKDDVFRYKFIETIKKIEIEPLINSKFVHFLFEIADIDIMCTILNIISSESLGFVYLFRISKDIQNKNVLKQFFKAILRSDFNTIKNDNYVEKIYFDNIYRLDTLSDKSISANLFLFLFPLFSYHQNIREVFKKVSKQKIINFRDIIFSQLRSEIVSSLLELKQTISDNPISENNSFYKILSYDIWEFCETNHEITELFNSNTTEESIESFCRQLDNILANSFKNFNTKIKIFFRKVTDLSDLIFNLESSESELESVLFGIEDFEKNIVKNILENQYKNHRDSTIFDSNPASFSNLINDKILNLLIDEDIKINASSTFISEFENSIPPLEDTSDIYSSEDEITININDTSYTIVNKTDENNENIFSVIEGNENKSLLFIGIDNLESLSEKLISLGINKDELERVNDKFEKVYINFEDEEKKNGELKHKDIIKEIASEINKELESKEKDNITTKKEIIKEVLADRFEKKGLNNIIIEKAIDEALKEINFEDL